MAASVPLEQARTRLAVVWFSGACVPFLILMVQSILGKYGEDVPKVWAWFVPNIGPTLSLILGIIGATALSGREDERCVRVFFLTLATTISVVYLTVLTLTLVLEPLSSLRGMELYNLSNYWLGPIQSLAVAAIAALFSAQNKVPDAKASDDVPTA